MKIICHRILCAFKPSVFLAFLPSPFNGVQVVTKTTVIALLIRSVERYDQVKIKQRIRKQRFRLCLRFRRLRPGE